MEILIKALQLILSLSILVFVHELGHYLTARMFGIRVEKFYLFFDAGGFSFFKFRIGETEFGLGWVPFGGYCKISGMIDESMDTEAMKKPAAEWEFRSKPAWQRLIVMVGGVAMNVVTACAIYIGMSWQWGESYIDNGDLRWGYAYNELAEEIGFRDGDRVVSFDGVAVEGNFAKIYSDMVIGGVRRVEVLGEGLEAEGAAGYVLNGDDGRLPNGDDGVPGDDMQDGVPQYDDALQGTPRDDAAGDDMPDSVPREIAIPVERTAEMLDSPDFMTPRVPFVVLQVAPGSSAEAAGMAAGDSLTTLNGEPAQFFDQYRDALTAAAGKNVRIGLVRDSAGVKVGRTLDIAVSPEGTLGVGVGVKTVENFFPIHTRRYGFGEGIAEGFRRTGAEIAGYWQQLKMIFSPKTKAYKQVGSIIAIGNFFPGEWNWYIFWRVTGFLSIILAVMNLLPIPALDGGHVVFTLWEVVTRRKPSDKFLERAQMVGMLILLAILVLAFWNDIYRFFIK
ncbi:MAG: site-2 protease family protein [Alistipes sp.]|jgi:regulator of sigma E protease|nr:site-2 protease family protein [Alistipes sp.]